MSVGHDYFTSNYKPRRCPYCGTAMLYGPEYAYEPRQATKDHVVPLSRGGKRGPLVWACRGCNEDKAQLALNEWRTVLSYRYRTLCLFWYERILIRATLAQAAVAVSQMACKVAP